MAQFIEFNYSYGDEQTREFFSNHTLLELLDHHRVSELEFNMHSFAMDKIRGQLSALANFFEAHPDVPRTVLNIGCGNHGDKGDQNAFGRGRLCDYYPWVPRALDFFTVNKDPVFARYGVARNVGVDIGPLRRETFEKYSLDVLTEGLDVVPGKFGVILAGAFFNSPTLSRQFFGDTRNDGGTWEYTKQIMDKLEPTFDSKLENGKKGVVLYNLS